MRELPGEWGLQLRMLLAAMLAVLFLIVPVAFTLVLVVTMPEGWKALSILALPAMVILVTVLNGTERWASWRSRQPKPRDDARVREALGRLALLAGVKVPLVEVTATARR